MHVSVETPNMVGPDVVGFSTGKLGRDLDRSFDRTYNNHEGLPHTDAGTFVDTFHSDQQVGDFDPRRRRWVYRGLTTPDVATQLMNGMGRNIRGVVEYAVPLETSEGGLYLVGAARNGHERNGPGTKLESQADLTGGVVIYENPSRTLEEHVARVTAQGFRFISNLNDENVFATVKEYWKKTYGWKDEELDDLRTRLTRETSEGFPQDKRTVALTGVVDKEGTLAAVTMAEVLPFRLTENKSFNLWESTEWYRNQDIKGEGLIGASIVLTNAQIAAINQDKGDYTSIAETNQATLAGAAARSAGMEVPVINFPGKEYIAPPQKLHHNVGLIDGKKNHGQPMIQGGKAYSLRHFDVYQAIPAHLEQLADRVNQRIVRSILAA